MTPVKASSFGHRIGFCRRYPGGSLALLAFKRTYNEQWMLEKYAYRSPAQVRRDLVGLDAAA